MIAILGELRKILDSSYTIQSTGEIKYQKILIIEPKAGRQNYEVVITPKQLRSDVTLKTWEKLISKQVSISVRLYVNHEFGFYKYIAIGDALPLELKQ